ncbi:MAG: XdhC family protein [Proteobacteria bacterium]|nr:XdhC family protein [Pseudomonadota bacterium]
MQAVDNEVLNQVRSWLNQGETCWLSTVIQTWGSSPRPIGSLFACNAAGHIVGSLSGGCVEDDLLEKLMKGDLAAERAQFFQYGISAEETEKLGLPCGGHLHIVVEPVRPDAATIDHFEHLTARVGDRRCVRRTVDLLHKTFAHSDVDKHEKLIWDEAGQTLTHTYGPRHQLFIIGAGMVSRYLADFAQTLDYHVTVCDPRKDLLETFAVPGTQLVADMPDDAVKKYANDPSSAIVALTHDPRIDDMGLMEALKTNAFYIGAMGSSRTSAGRRERLKMLDLTEAQIDRLHAPIGLAIGSKTPPEIAISVIAEITAVRHGIAAAREPARIHASAG